MAEKILQLGIEKELYNERIQWMVNNLETSQETVSNTLMDQSIGKKKKQGRLKT